MNSKLIWGYWIENSYPWLIFEEQIFKNYFMSTNSKLILWYWIEYSYLWRYFQKRCLKNNKMYKTFYLETTFLLSLWPPGRWTAWCSMETDAWDPCYFCSRRMAGAFLLTEMVSYEEAAAVAKRPTLSHGNNLYACQPTVNKYLCEA